MKYPFIFLLITFIFSNSILSQEYLFLEPSDKHLLCGHLSKFKNNKQLMLADDVERRPYDILTMDLFMDWTNPLSSDLETPEDRYYTGVSKILARIDSNNTDFIELDAENFTFQRITYQNITQNSQLLDRTTQSVYSEGVISIPVSDLSVGDEIYIEIEFTYVGEENDGFHIYKEGYIPASTGQRDGPVSKRLAYTMSQPIDARNWMPCNDDPYEKQISSIAIKVPDQFIVASNGLIDSIITDESTKTFYWSDDKPIPSYLMVANASEYYVWEEKVERRSNTLDSINIINYTWETDLDEESNNFGFKAIEALSTIPNQMRAFEEYFTDYPWDQYGTVAIYPFWAGGMEHQTMESVNRTWLRGADAGLAHELAHMWLGDMVTCASWADIWMNEGGATWGEALWRGWRDGIGGYNAQITHDRIRYLNISGLEGPPMYGFKENNVFSRYELIYFKAAWVYHMLDIVLGKDQYFEVLRKYIKEFEFKSISSHDMIEFFKENIDSSKVDLDTYFDQWVYSAGHPVYDINVRTKELNGRWRYRIDIEQIQDQLTSNEQVPETFITPIQLVFVYGEEHRKREFMIDEKTEFFEIYYTELADSVMFDIAYTLGEVRDLNLTGVKSLSKNDLNIFPNPVNTNKTNISISTEKNAQTILELYTSDGAFIREIYNSYLSAGNYKFDIDCSGLNSGVYFVRIRNGEDLVTEKFIISRD